MPRTRKTNTGGKVETDERQFLLTIVWLFMRHGQPDRARTICEALAEADPRDGIAAVALAQLCLADGDPGEALVLLRATDAPPELEHAQAVLETRALRLLGRTSEAQARWRRHIESRRGAKRQWVQ